MAQLEFDCAIQNIPYPGLLVSGDFTYIKHTNDYSIYLLGDVAGHGHRAHMLAKNIIAFSEDFDWSDVENYFQEIHAYLNGSDGCVIGLIAIAENNISYYGCGNILLKHFSAKQKITSFYGSDGVIGYQCRPVLIKKIDLQLGDVMIIQSDGVSSRYNFEDYKNILDDDVENIANFVVHDSTNNNDDASCLVLKAKK